MGMRLGSDTRLVLGVRLGNGREVLLYMRLGSVHVVDGGHGAGQWTRG